MQANLLSCNLQVVSFFFFTDLLVDGSIVYSGEPSKLNSYEQATTTFIFFNILLSITATVGGSARAPVQEGGVCMRCACMAIRGHVGGGWIGVSTTR